MSLSSEAQMAKKHLDHRWHFPVPHCHENVLRGTSELASDISIDATKWRFSKVLSAQSS